MISRLVAIAVAGGALLMPNLASATTLTLLNGWNRYSLAAVPSVTLVNGIAHMKGAISHATTSTLTEPFTLPVGLRPSANAYVKLDLCDSTNGRLFIQPSGDVTIETESQVAANAQCFTSLDGVSFAVSSDGFKPLKLQNGWTGRPFGTGVPAAEKLAGIVRLSGAMSTSGTNELAFVLPVAMRPSSSVNLSVEMCGAKNGQLLISSSGNAFVEINGAFSNAQCLTSLDGVNFPINATGYTPLTLENGWTNAPFGTRDAAAAVSNNVVQFEGAIASGSGEIFIMPAGMRPSSEAYIPLIMCDSTNGRLIVQPDGTATVQPENSYSYAQCMTSLEGASFHR